MNDVVLDIVEKICDPIELIDIASIRYDVEIFLPKLDSPSDGLYPLVELAE